MESIIKELRDAHDGDPWHGSSRAVLLHGVTAAAAALRPIPKGHTVWELVLHMTAWTREVARRMRGNTAATPAEGDWPQAPRRPSEADWQQAISALGEAHLDLLRSVADFPESKLDTPVGDERNPALGSGVTYRAMLHGTAQHDAYHSGQIALLKKLLGDREKSSSE